MKNYDEERSKKLLKLYTGALTDIIDSMSLDFRNKHYLNRKKEYYESGF